MREALLIASFAAGTFGFALLAFSQHRHWERLTGQRDCPAAVATGFRILASLLIFAALPLAILAQGASFGSLLWVVCLSVAALAVALLLTSVRQAQPRRAGR